MKVAIVTGGNRGIGLAITRCLESNGWSVQVVHNNEERYGTTNLIHEYMIDVSIKEQVDGFFTHSLDWLATADISQALLVNNAGVASAKKFMDLEPEDFTRMFSVNTIGAFNMSKAFVRWIQGTAAIASIINISSVSGLTGFSGHAHYCASKFALDGMSKTMAKELSKVGIRVNNVCPGPTQTEMWTQLDKEYREGGFMPKEMHEDDYMSKLLIKRMGNPDDVALAVLFLATHHYITGINLPVCGGNIMM